MRNHLYIVSLFLALFATVSCKKDSHGGEDDANILCKREAFSASNGSYSIYPVWKSDDAIAAVSDGNATKFTLRVGAGGSSASFEGSLKEAVENFCWVYPYSENVRLSGSTLTLDFPQTQYAGTHICSPAFGARTKEGEAVQMQNLCSALSFKLKGTGIVKQAVLTSLDENEALWGRFGCDISIAPAIRPRAASISGGGPSLILDCGQGVNLTTSGSRIEFAVPVGSLKKGFSVEFLFLDGKRRTMTVKAPADDIGSRVFTCAPDETMDPLVVCLENYMVKQYLSTVHYPDNDYSFTLVESYANAKTDYRKDRPAPVSLKWKGVSGASSQKLQISRQADFSAIEKEIQLGQASSAVEIYNLIPGNEYFYRVLAEVGTVKDSLVTCSNFYTEGRRRFLYIDNINNVRDLGGQITADGKKRIRYGKLFRGSEMQGKKGLTFTDKGRSQMREEKIAMDMDFRRDDEKLGYIGSPIGQDIIYRQFPKADNHYTKILKTNSYVSSVRWTIKRFMEEPDKAIYFHCAVGADRTGMHAFLIEGICGIGEEDLAKDYELTSFSNPPGIRRRTSSPYDYAGFIKLMKGLSGATLQDKCYTYLTGGVVEGGDRIGREPIDSVAWLRNFLLEDIQ